MVCSHVGYFCCDKEVQISLPFSRTFPVEHLQFNQYMDLIPESTIHFTPVLMGHTRP